MVKKAYILGVIDPQYQDLMKNVGAMVFLATPHRGSALADSLNMLLSYSPLNHSPKLYITELQKNSRTLHEINETFRHYASKVHIVSFFETVPTAVGPKRLVRQCQKRFEVPFNDIYTRLLLKRTPPFLVTRTKFQRLSMPITTEYANLVVEMNQITGMFGTSFIP